MEKNYTAMLSEYIAGIQYEQLPQEVLDQVKRLTLHVMMPGSKQAFYV